MDGRATSVLVIDADELSLRVQEKTLWERGLSVQTATNGEEGLEEFSRWAYDIAVVEMDLDGIGGLETVRRIRDVDPSVVVMVTTHRDDVDSAIGALEAGAFRYLRKPLGTDVYNRKLDEAFRERRRIVDTRRLIGDLVHVRGRLQERVLEQSLQLTRTERYLYQLLDAAPFAIYSADGEDKVITYNRTAQSTYGYRREDVLGQPLALLMGDRSANGQVAGEHRRADGSRFPVEVHDSRIVDERGVAVAQLFIVEDLSTRRRLEDQLLFAERLSLLGQLAPRVAHELKTPLQLIQGHAELARTWLLQTKPDRALQSVERIAPSVDQVLGLVRELTHLGRPADSNPDDLDLRRELDRLLETLQHLGAVKYCQIVRHYEEKLPAVHQDPVALEQVFRNLIVNAAHAMEEGDDRRLTLGLETVDGQVVATIADTGCGISDADRARIFNPFFTTKPEGKGTGLGLPIVKTILDRGGVAVEVDSVVGEGTRFRLTFPPPAGVADAERQQVAHAD